MLNKKVLALFFGLMVLFSFNSCKSTKVDDPNSIYVMIYDYENKPLNGMSIYLDNKLLGVSDINGRFIFELNDTEEHLIELKSDDYEVVKDKIVYEKLLVLYYKVGNIKQLINLAQKELDSKKYEKALSYIQRAEIIDSEREDVLYLKAVIYYKMENKKAALETLNKIKVTSENSEYIKGFKKRLENEK